METQINSLIPYKDWLMLTRGKLEPMIGDVMVKPEVITSYVQKGDETNYIWDIAEDGQYLSKTIIENQWRLNLINRMIESYKKRNLDFLADYYVEVPYIECNDQYTAKECNKLCLEEQIKLLARLGSTTLQISDVFAELNILQQQLKDLE